METVTEDTEVQVKAEAQATEVAMDPKKIAAADSAYWAQLYRIKLQTGPFSFVKHEYQLEPMHSPARRKCHMKGTQMGITEIAVLNSLHGMIYGRYPLGVMYLFPTADDVTDFSKSRFSPLIRGNREAIGQFVKVGGKGTDTAGLKQIRGAFLYLRGARLSQSIGIGSEEKESSKLRSAPVDCCVFDEVDLMDEDVIAKAKGRMGHSPVQEEIYLSNPTLPDYGIDKLFQTSDQRHWFRRCGCGTWTCPELTFPECVHVRPDRTGYIACKKCGAEVKSDWNSEWVPAKPDNTPVMEGYRESQLMSSFIDPADILRDFNDPPQGNVGDVYRLKLGLPYVAAEDRLTPKDVLQCCNVDVMPNWHAGPCAMGVDVGKIKHIIIGVRTGNETYEIVKVIRLSKWPDIHDIAQKFHVRSAVIDARPYEDEARSFQTAERYKIFLCEYAENTALGTTYNDASGLVRVNRTEIFDATHRIISQKKLVIPRDCDEVQEFVEQCCGTAKVLETNKKTGTSIYRYRKLGDDHYRNALNYFMLAASGSRIARVGPVHQGPAFTKNEYARI